MDDLSFVDVDGGKDSKNINKDECSKSSFDSEQDEWLDVDVVTSSTTNEERLRNQVRALQRALDEKNLELMETNVQVDVLKGHKILLENAKSNLQEKLEGQATAISKLQEDLNSSNEQVIDLGKKLQDSESMLQSTAAELHSYQERNKEMELEIKNLREVLAEESRIASLKIRNETKLAEELKDNLMAKEQDIKNRDANLIKLHRDLMASQDLQITLQQKLASVQEEKNQLEHQVERLRSDTGSIAVVAENLRVEKQSLERKLQHSLGKLQESQNKVQELQGTLANMKGTHQLKEEEHKQWQLQQQLQQEDEMKTFSDILTSKTRELEDTKGAVTQLAAEVSATRAEAEHAKEALQVMKQKYERYAMEQQHLQEELREREELLRLELVQIRTANEERLEELRQILGLRFRDILVRSKSRSVVPPPATATTNPTKTVGYVPPPILRAVMGLV